VVISFDLYLKGLSLYLNWTMATWVRNCLILLSPCSWMPGWDLQPLCLLQHKSP